MPRKTKAAESKEPRPEYIEANVINAFIDKDNGSYCLKGAVVTLPIKRYEELKEQGFVQ